MFLESGSRFFLIKQRYNFEKKLVMKTYNTLIPALIDECTETQIIARLPYSAAGVSSISVFVEDVGLARNLEDLSVTFAFQVRLENVLLRFGA